MPRYLSPEWLEAAQRAIDASEALREAVTGLDMVVQHVVTGGSDGAVTYHVRFDGNGVAIRAGQAPDPTVVFTEDYATAAAIGRGDLSAQGAFMTGRIRVHGDLPSLVGQSDALSGIDDVLAGLRAETSY
jgi:putative sterol carrier protein